VHISSSEESADAEGPRYTPQIQKIALDYVAIRIWPSGTVKVIALTASR